MKTFFEKKVDSEYLRDKFFFPILWGVKKSANNNAKTHRKLLSKLGTWENPNSSIFLKNKLQDWGVGMILYFLFLFPKKGKERKGMECGGSI
jgi:hypothetical protein